MTTDVDKEWNVTKSRIPAWLPGCAAWVIAPGMASVPVDLDGRLRDCAFEDDDPYLRAAVAAYEKRTSTGATEDEVFGWYRERDSGVLLALGEFDLVEPPERAAILAELLIPPQDVPGTELSSLYERRSVPNSCVLVVPEDGATVRWDGPKSSPVRTYVVDAFRSGLPVVLSHEHASRFRASSGIRAWLLRNRRIPGGGLLSMVEEASTSASIAAQRSIKNPERSWVMTATRAAERVAFTIAAAATGGKMDRAVGSLSHRFDDPRVAIVTGGGAYRVSERSAGHIVVCHGGDIRALLDRPGA